ncbi:PREDICTED: LOW QUALITY PROTEIN: protein MIZU-KUSSEI 1 [Tarenaya hassleriana]|uniref:LOW QUALITY PROTEIN: protein MIZU-KUSSEI 1 n=1 Tax=Tarenaya hassleriana TaxID=28532 RepID=UPI00053C1BD3|nr:PREDICTED: LOW QUALITY PROTEIN: protein MIZU-KUSSEI 1 [Tarenaya hassleriana]
MTKIDALRRFLLPCISPSVNSAAAAGATKKRLSTSLRDDIVAGGGGGDHDSASSASSGESSDAAAAPQRPSKTMVIGTIFGRRKGHVWFCVQHDRLSKKPLLLLELSIATNQLVHEMGSGLVRVALECPTRPELSSCPLRSVPVWKMYCNGRKLGFAVRRGANEETNMMLKKLQSTTIGAGVLPSGSGSEPDPDEVMYMRANYEHVVGNSDSESFHLINPDVNSAQELSIFLLRTSS